jgi:tetratricopeptide (TPR) repeat protein
MVVAAVAVLVVLSMAASSQLRTWKSNVTVFETCLGVDPDNALARWALSQRGDSQADGQGTSPHNDLDDPDALGHAAAQAATGDGQQASDYGSAIQLARRACQLTQWNQPRYLHLLATVYSESAKQLGDGGEFRKAAGHFRIALEAKPDHLPALFQLAALLATSRDQELRNPQEAVRLARRARQLMGQPDPNSLMVLAAVHAEAWEFDTAISLAEQAIELARQAGQDDLEQQLTRRLEFYRKRIPPEISRY